MYLEKRKEGSEVYWYMVRSVRSGKKTGKQRVYLGKGLSRKEAEQAAVRQEALLDAKVATARKGPLDGVLSLAEERALERLRVRFKRRKLDPEARRNRYERFVSEFTYDTNAIEGSRMSLQETASLLFERVVPFGRTREEVSVAENHKAAFDYMIGYRGGLTTGFVLRLHRLLMHDVLWKQAGAFRDVGVYLSGSKVVLPAPEAVPGEFKRMMLWYRANAKRYHPVVVAAYMHYRFERVHPFRDGNGRVGRLLMNFMLRKAGFPMVNVVLEDRFPYYAALDAADRGELRPLVGMVMKYLLEKKEQLL